MIVKLIHHNNMKRSANYLYEKAINDPDNAGQHPMYSMQSSTDEFLTAIDQLKEMRFEKTRRQSLTNNQIKHLVLSCHPKDTESFEKLRDNIIEDLFKTLEISPENHLTNIFIHNDAAHPHVHVLFSRIGEDLSVVNDSKLGVRVGEFAEKISKEYGLVFKTETPRISFSRKDLYRPTERTALLKLIDFAMKEAVTFENYLEIMKQHKVKFVKTEDGVAYLIPNPNLVDKNEIPRVLIEAKKTTKSRDEYKKYLLAHGIKVSWDEVGKEVLSLKKHTIVLNKYLPKEAKGKLLRDGIERSNHDKTYLMLREDLIKGIESCETLGDIQKLLPKSKMSYKIIGNRIENISFDFEGLNIRLHEAFLMDVHIRPHNEVRPMDIPIFFSPRVYDNDFEEQRQLHLKKKDGKKHYQIGFKFQI